MISSMTSTRRGGELLMYARRGDSFLPRQVLEEGGAARSLRAVVELALE
jgi:hypothetical protein